MNLNNESDCVEMENLPDRVKNFQPSEGPQDSDQISSLAFDETDSLENAVSHLEKTMIASAMKQFDGNISKAARKLGLSRQGMHNKLHKYGMKTG